MKDLAQKELSKNGRKRPERLKSIRKKSIRILGGGRELAFPTRRNEAQEDRKPTP